ncbi:MAG: hypothetical protein NVSMB13_12350 [Mycobacteriales bacterium]
MGLAPADGLVGAPVPEAAGLAADEVLQPAPARTKTVARTAEREKRMEGGHPDVGETARA